MAQITPQANDFEAFDEIENIGSNPDPKTPIAEIIEARYGRRGLLISAAALTARGTFQRQHVKRIGQGAITQRLICANQQIPRPIMGKAAG